MKLASKAKCSTILTQPKKRYENNCHIPNMMQAFPEENGGLIWLNNIPVI